MYRVAQKVRDFKDDLKIFYSEDFNFNFWLWSSSVKKRVGKNPYSRL